jgi:NitT/TauT family transport system permease protein
MKANTLASPLAPEKRRPKLKMLARNLGLGIVVPLCVLILWQLVGQSGLMAGVIPTPMKVMHAWYDWIFADPGMGMNPYLGTWVSNVKYSTIRVAEGFLLAMVLGIPLGLAIGWSRISALLFDPSIQAMRPIPITAWLPFSIALFGIQNMGAVFLIFLGGFYATVVNTTQGARDGLVFAFGASRGSRAERDVVPDVQPGEKRVLLEDDPPVGPRLLDGFAVHLQFARSRALEPRDHVQQGGFSATRGPQQRNEFTACHVQRDIVQRHHRRRARVHLAHAPYFYSRHPFTQ